jgi:Fur family ferric uptake transcriptional regulator
MEAGNLLRAHSLRITDVRIMILDLFINNSVALSEQNIEQKLNANCDRVTVYRTLKSFVDKGLVHKVLDEGNIVKYALCGNGCSEQNHRHEHVHFKCNNCGTTVCLENIPIQKVQLPKGFQQDESNLLVLGTCNNCN